MTFLYRAYGLTLASTARIHALPITCQPSTPVDLHIWEGEKPVWVSRALASTVGPEKRSSRYGVPEDTFAWAECADGCVELKYADGSRFLLSADASRIWGEAGPGLSLEDFCVYLLGPVMGFVLRRRGCLVLHASAVVLEGSAYALCGEAGSGKSTLAAALVLRGHSLLCEDVCALQEQSETTTVAPGYPRVCLWPESVKILFSSVDALPRIVHGWNKRYLPLDGVRGKFAQGHSPLAGIYLLAPRSDAPAAPFVERLPLTEATMQLVQNTYMNYLLSKEQRAAEFASVARLASTVPCFRLTASRDPARVPELVSLIERHSGSVPSHV